MNLLDFIDSFMEEIDEEKKRTNEVSEVVFLERMGSYLTEYEEIPEIESSFYQKTYKNRQLKVNGYYYNNDASILSLFMVLFDIEKTNKALSSTNAKKELSKALYFYQASREGLTIEESNEEARELLNLIRNNHRKINQLHIYLMTNLNYKSNELISFDSKDPDVKTIVWDIERFYQLVNEAQGLNQIEINFPAVLGETFEVLKVHGTPEQEEIYDCYIGFIPGELLARSYDLWGQRLIERNVRSFLQAKGSVNKGIRKTLQQESNMFVAYNNGISTVAEEVDLEALSAGSNSYKVNIVKGWQIVNGGQTTASLYHAWKEKIPLDQVNVQIKMTVVKQKEKYDEMISAISKYANTQNKIQLSDLDANHSVHVELEKLSRTIWVPDPYGLKSQTKWFYERARGQYLVEENRQGTPAKKREFKKQNPKSQIITKTLLAKYVMLWDQKPYIVSKGNEKNFAEFMKLVQEEKVQVDSNYYKQVVAKAIIFNECDTIVKKLKFGGYKANIVAYTMAILSCFYKDRINLNRVWETQQIGNEIEKEIDNIARFVWDHITNPPVKGTNITEWCKKEDCWKLCKEKFSQKMMTTAKQTMV